MTGTVNACCNLSMVSKQFRIVYFEYVLKKQPTVGILSLRDVVSVTTALGSIRYICYLLNNRCEIIQKAREYMNKHKSSEGLDNKKDMFVIAKPC